MISLTNHKNSTVRIEIINYRMMLEARVGPAYLREAELVLISMAINIPFIRNAFIFGLRRQLERCNNMLFYRLPTSLNINVCWNELDYLYYHMISLAFLSWK